MKNRKNISGFTLIELMISLLITAVLFIGVVALMTEITSGSRTQDARTEQTQEARFLLSVMSTDFKNAGSVISLSHTGSFLSTAPLFNGIVPINQTNAPDGAIVAAADPFFLTKTSAAFNPSSDTVINVDKTFLDETLTGDNAKPWEVGDKIMIMAPDGYYVAYLAEVPSAGATSLQIRDTAVYYSKLLDDAGGYKDPILTTAGVPPTQKGSEITYPVKSPVMRLNNFSIYLVNDKHELYRVTDTKGKAAIIGDNSIVGGAIASNIIDMQIVYRAYPNFPNTTGETVNFYSTDTTDPNASNSNDTNQLLNNIRNKLMKDVNINFVVKTGDYDGKDTLDTKIPSIGDRAERTINKKYTTRLYRLNVELKNYSIIL